MGDVNSVREYLDKNGWIQEDLYGYGDSACIVGAVSKTSAWNALDFIEQVVLEQYPDRLGFKPVARPVVRFNDHPRTTYADVVAVMEKASILEMENG
jgi:hypothetical protein